MNATAAFTCLCTNYLRSVWTPSEFLSTPKEDSTQDAFIASNEFCPLDLIFPATSGGSLPFKCEIHQRYVQTVLRWISSWSSGHPSGATAAEVFLTIAWSVSIPDNERSSVRAPLQKSLQRAANSTPPNRPHWLCKWLAFAAMGEMEQKLSSETRDQMTLCANGTEAVVLVPPTQPSLVAAAAVEVTGLTSVDSPAQHHPLTGLNTVSGE